MEDLERAVRMSNVQLPITNVQVIVSPSYSPITWILEIPCWILVILPSHPFH